MGDAIFNNRSRFGEMKVNSSATAERELETLEINHQLERENEGSSET